jgi:glycosyltransferase involved in cell wall biosynthesis
MSEPTVAIVTKAKATFFKPLYEAFARAQPAGWKTILAWPEGRRSEHPDESVTPCVPNLDVCMVPCRTFSVRQREKRTDGRALSAESYLPSRALWHLLASRDIRAVLIHEYSPYTLQALVFAKARHIPAVVSSEIGRRNRATMNLPTRLWHSLWGRFADGIVACSPAAREPLSGGVRPTVSTYHAVDSRIYRPVKKPIGTRAPVVFAYLGQLIQRKGLDLFLKAAARLRDEGTDGFRIRLIGGGDEQWVRGWIRELRLEEKVELTGFLSGPAIRDALGSADVFVLPTRQDTYAAVVHEAACLALPLLISRHAGAAEALVADGRNGFVFDPENAEQFAVLMRKLMQPGLRESMGAISRSTAEPLSAHVRGRALWEWMDQTFALSS